ncbi:hypothetical protein Rsub_05627 [Raphidocelis subcapitata]|uniref:Uncharacterized protein n=1 Tax=Raphidocelis subcapitata TaxID=307507 RepID=A0A2V0NZH6_9CHLO|nr:hypothetical protein Rsub_05627 [Raphidocelis subcapitata]|eukprot:GBF93016.1 hypothetical protein Rsub_05627 [Raphidocelis subcapitata]
MDGARGSGEGGACVPRPAPPPAAAATLPPRSGAPRPAPPAAAATLPPSSGAPHPGGQPGGSLTCGLLLRLPGDRERAFWHAAVNEGPSAARFLAWDSVALLIGVFNTRALAASESMMALTPNPHAFRVVIHCLAYISLAQVALMQLARERVYRRHRMALIGLSRLSRFALQLLSMLRIGATAPAVPPPRSQHAVQLVLLGVPMSLVQQPLLYFMPVALQAPLALAKLAMYAGVWVPRSLLPLLEAPGFATDSTCALLHAALAGARSAGEAAFGVAPCGEVAPDALVGGSRCCRCLLAAASTFFAFAGLTFSTVLGWTWEFRAKREYAAAHGQRLSVRLPLGASPALARLAAAARERGVPLSGASALLPGCAAAAVLLWWAAEAAVGGSAACAGACITAA